MRKQLKRLAHLLSMIGFIVFSGTGYFANHMVYWLRDTEYKEYKLRNARQFSADKSTLAVCKPNEVNTDALSDHPQ